MPPKTNNTFYHHQDKGCILVPAAKKVANAKGKVYTHKVRDKILERMLYFSICTTHGVDVCRCGWQFTRHPINQDKDC